MTPEERARLNRREKQAAYLRRVGRPLYVDPGPAVKHAQILSRRGMTAAQIAGQAGVSVSAVRDYVRGTRTSDRGGYELKNSPRWVSDAILAVRFEPPEDVGAAIDGTGLRRRLRALNRLGFSSPVLGAELGVSRKRVNELMTRETPVRYANACRVEQLYDKLSGSRPEDHGVPRSSIIRAQAVAVRNGYAPPGCWDPETIDDPEALPEWTGACGSAAGLRIHYRESIPPCEACLATRHESDVRPRLNGSKLKAMREKRGWTIRQVADQLGLTIDAVYAWEIGRSAPRTEELLDRLATLMHCDHDDLCEE